jgi:hypothetical protein
VVNNGKYRLRQFTLLCRHGDGDGGGDAEARRDITSARGGPLHSSTDFSAFGAQPSREAFVEPQTQTEQPSTPAHAAAMRIIELVIDVCGLIYVRDAR